MWGKRTRREANHAICRGAAWGHGSEIRWDPYGPGTGISEVRWKLKSTPISLHWHKNNNKSCPKWICSSREHGENEKNMPLPLKEKIRNAFASLWEEFRNFKVQQGSQRSWIRAETPSISHFEVINFDKNMSKEGGKKAKYKHQECKCYNFHATLRDLHMNSHYLLSLSRISFTLFFFSLPL